MHPVRRTRPSCAGIRRASRMIVPHALDSGRVGLHPFLFGSRLGRRAPALGRSAAGADALVAGSAIFESPRLQGDHPGAARPLRRGGIIHDLVGKGSQFIVATHSPLIMAYPNAWIYLLLDDKIERVEYTDTEHFALTRAFLNDHRRMLRRLLDDEAL